MLDALQTKPVPPRTMRRVAEMTTGERAAWEAGVMQAAALMEWRAGRCVSDDAKGEAAGAAVLLRLMAGDGPDATTETLLPL